jgi:hypothetical protein
MKSKKTVDASHSKNLLFARPPVLGAARVSAECRIADGRWQMENRIGKCLVGKDEVCS